MIKLIDILSVAMWIFCTQLFVIGMICILKDKNFFKIYYCIYCGKKKCKFQVQKLECWDGEYFNYYICKECLPYMRED